MRVVSALLVLLVTLSAFPALSADQKESAYDRVMRTGTIRCGYIVGSPYIMRDPNTGALSGIWHDYSEVLGKALSLKIDWAQEVGYGDYAEALDSGRIDAMCVGLWINPSRARVSDFVVPITYQTIYAWTRAGDTRFDKNMDAVNDPAIRVSCIDGEMSAIIAQEDFPKAALACLPQSVGFSDLFMQVTQKKADIVFASAVAVGEFNRNNKPGLRMVSAAYPVRTFPEALAVARGDDDFRRMLDHTTQFLLDSGKINAIIVRYAKPGDFQYPIKPYEVTQ
ncbi:MAG: transporter substrate-binding domain-containing protein [Rhodospirillales bacterium]|nr:transporter substrate-binding domain-containing protein [Alphaproteobacteria bacterium]MCB9986666.1 transporter substrate-binding domain-containing protein [Rhodospirillales bacterium]USO06807.1 MAG: transporter substrate-binding domain-containing protein [Rhodospirillales bacterium]